MITYFFSFITYIFLRIRSSGVKNMSPHKKILPELSQISLYLLIDLKENKKKDLHRSIANLKKK